MEKFGHNYLHGVELLNHSLTITQKDSKEKNRHQTGLTIVIVLCVIKHDPNDQQWLVLT